MKLFFKILITFSLILVTIRLVRYYNLAKDEQSKINAIKQFYEILKKNDKKKFSQNGEDGVILKLAEYINKTRKGIFVEFGAANGDETNTRILREKYQWTGLLMDSYIGHNYDPQKNFYREEITHENILDLFEKYNIKKDFDLLSQDTDYADYWILEKILSKYIPKMIVVETNQEKGCVTVAKPTELTYWDGNSRYAGASLCAYLCLAKQYGYTIIYCEKSNVNCFWIRNDLLINIFHIKIGVFRQIFTSSFLRPAEPNLSGQLFKKWFEIEC